PPAKECSLKSLATLRTHWTASRSRKAATIARRLPSKEAMVVSSPPVDQSINAQLNPCSPGGGRVNASAHHFHRNKTLFVLIGELGKMLLAKLRGMLAPNLTINLNRLIRDVVALRRLD